MLCLILTSDPVHLISINICSQLIATLYLPILNSKFYLSLKAILARIFMLEKFQLFLIDSPYQLNQNLSHFELFS